MSKWISPMSWTSIDAIGRRSPMMSVAFPAIVAILVGFVGSIESDAQQVPEEEPITAEDREHWSFRPLTRPAVTAVKNTAWPRNAIDCFILTKIEKAGLRPMPATDRVTLLRRVTFDLTGLPPTPAEIDAFLNNASADAYEQLVDRLLGSSTYGERWALHWLDLARFAETDGFEHDHLRPNAWRYRDWVIDALNADMPYDEFVQLQLAGDELRPGDPQAAIATGFLLCGPDMPDINLQEERRHTFLNDMTDTVGSVFLGLHVGCAQCHNHKFDPVSQYDFYRLRAFFENADLFGDKSISPELPLGRVMKERTAQPKPSYLRVRGDFRRKGPEVAPAYLRIVNASNENVPRPLPGANTSGRRTALAKWLTQRDHPLTTRVIVNRLWQHHFGHGLSSSPSNFGITGDPPTHPQLMDWLASELPRRGWSLKQMHRLMVTSATYRQAGRRRNSERSPAENRQAEAIWRKSQRQDPDNELWTRMSRRRLEGETIRDAMLAAAGTLNRRRGGGGIRPPLPKELLATLLKNQWPVTTNVADHYRRSIYLFVRRNLRYPIFDVFDKPDTNASCPRRNRSTIAPQALMLLNSKLSLSAARELAGSLRHRAGSQRGAGSQRERQVELCYLKALSRRPTGEEQQLAVRFLSDVSARLQKEGRDASQLALPNSLPPGTNVYDIAALTDLCLAIFNLNEFIYID
jgi:hypothetical protein